MIKMVPLKIQVALFGSFLIEANPDNLIKVLTDFKEFSLMPQSAKEIDVTTGQLANRLAFSSISGWNVFFGANRIDLSLNNTNIDQEVDINPEDVLSILPKLAGMGVKSFNRVAYIAEYFLPSEEGVEKKIFEKLFACRDTGDANDWVYRYCAKKELGGEFCNRITEISRVQGFFVVGQENPKLMDKIKLLLDLNTSAENSEARFDLNQASEMLKVLQQESTVQINSINSWVEGCYE